MRVIIGGMRRSGTHWMWNAVRLLCEHVAPGQVYAVAAEPPFDHYYDAQRAEPWHVIKTHYYESSLATSDQRVVIFTTSRPWHDAMASYRRFTGELPPAETQAAWLAAFHRWRRRADYHMDYDQLLSGWWYPPLCAMSVVLDIQPDIPAIEAQLRAIRPPTHGARDPVTLLFPRHWTSKEVWHAHRQHGDDRQPA